MFFSQVAFIALALLYKNKISFSWFVRLQSTDATWTLKRHLRERAWQRALLIFLKKINFAS